MFNSYSKVSDREIKNIINHQHDRYMRKNFKIFFFFSRVIGYKVFKNNFFKIYTIAKANLETKILLGNQSPTLKSQE